MIWLENYGRICVQLRLESIYLSREHFMHRFDELIEKLIVNCVCMYVFDGEGGQAIEGDRGKQPETSNK